MAIFNSWRPQKMLEEGDQQIQEARLFLQNYGARLTQARRYQAEDLLTK
jgi:hypothetical protein